MLIQLLIRFAFGGTLVCLFSLLGEMLHPKSFAGLFGAAPSVAIASLVLAFATHGSTYVAIEASCMVAGAIALAVYSVTAMRLVHSRSVAPWMACSGLYFQWLAVALAIWAVALR